MGLLPYRFVGFFKLPTLLYISLTVSTLIHNFTTILIKAIQIFNISVSQSSRNRRSWIWLYFNRISATCAQCKLCNRNICHGGNATGNMNRHLKMIHQKTGGKSLLLIYLLFFLKELDLFVINK